MARYCFGGGLAGRLGGSTDYVNTVVLAHPSNLKPRDIRALKVGNRTSNSDGLTYFPPQVPSCFVLAEGNTTVVFLVVGHIVQYSLQRTCRLKIKMSREPGPYSRSKRGNPITLTMSSGFGRVIFHLSGHENTSHGV